ncbi:MAG TPA: TonB-dependent receptor [Luteimonas sp.]|nr:TonB-dependent receptor [Luteimonas sp.]
MQGTRKQHRRRATPTTLTRLPLAAAIYLAFGSMAWAQSAGLDPQPATTESQVVTTGQAAKDEPLTLGTVTVTAQKRTENLQKVPISIQVLGEEKLKQQNVADFDDYAKLIPSLSYGTAGGGVFSGPGFVQVYMRGVSSGGDGNHSGSQPSVGMYLDEQPITTVQGALDIHMYDIERVEALAGPQGTLYGASSQSGTVRIITKKPDPSGYAAGYAVEVNAIDGGGIGHVVEGFVNAPLSPAAAIRMVGWQKHDAGYVDNVFGTRTYASSGPLTIDNADRAKDNYNWADTVGARAALKIDLNDNWSITPTIMGQHQKANGSTGYDPSVGDLAVTHFKPETSDDRWTQAALTVQGKIGNFDLTYAYSHLKRDVDSQADYTDYSFWYDYYFSNDSGNLIDPTQHIRAKDGYTKTSHELRLTSPAENRLRLVAGLFWQQQGHDIEQDYLIDGLAQSSWVTGWPDTIWLTEQDRIDRDEAVFGELSFDITDKLTASAGGRYFRAKNNLRGFFGYGDWGWSQNGEASCISQEDYEGAPCLRFDKETSESGSLGRFNLTYHVDDDKMVYATWSEGYRPGGINRRGPLYTSDFLTNYELGWKTAWMDHRLTFNGAVFQENWKDFQFSFLGTNGLTEIRNAGQARIRGLEAELNWAATYNLRLSGGLALYDSKLTQNYCGFSDQNGDPETNCANWYILNPPDDPDSAPLPSGAPAGTRLPLTARYKGNVNARYTFDLWSGEAFWQATVFTEGDRRTDLRTYEGGLLGDLKPYTMADLSAGFHRSNWSVEFFLKNAFDTRAQLARFSQCAAAVCGEQPYTVVAQPRTLGVRFSQDF